MRTFLLVAASVAGALVAMTAWSHGAIWEGVACSLVCLFSFHLLVESEGR